MVERIPSKRPSGVAHPDAHDKNGRFKKGHVVYTRRERGNRVSNDLKDAILHGAAAHGSDGKGKNGLNGYLEFWHKNTRELFVPVGKIASVCCAQHGRRVADREPDRFRYPHCCRKVSYARADGADHVRFEHRH